MSGQHKAIETSRDADVARIVKRFAFHRFTILKVIVSTEVIVGQVNCGHPLAIGLSAFAIADSTPSTADAVQEAHEGAGRRGKGDSRITAVVKHNDIQYA